MTYILGDQMSERRKCCKKIEGNQWRFFPNQSLLEWEIHSTILFGTHHIPGDVWAQGRHVPKNKTDLALPDCSVKCREEVAVT